MSAWEIPLEEEATSWTRQHRGKLLAGVLLAGAGLLFAWPHLFPHRAGAAVRRDNLVVVNVPPPPPPPPPPPMAQTPPPPQEEKMIDQAPVENETKPDPVADEPPPADLGTGLQGNGPADGFGLSGRGAGGGGGHGAGSAAARSRWGWYASQVQGRIQQAVRGNRTTRAADLRADVKIWADASGRITRATLAAGTGNPALDAALRDQVLSGLQLSEPPPEGMPMPIVLRVTARRP